MHLLILLISFMFCTNIEAQEVDVLKLPDYRDHPCKRVCVPGEKKVCYYHLTLEYIFSNEGVCLKCLSGTDFDCDNPNCIVADGNNRLLTVYNRMLPGPSIEVCQGDVLVIDVTNSLDNTAATIHWHGMHQLETPFMDGVPFITQCPIHPGNTFRYNFEATQEGTHFYHSHSALQRANGAFGHLVVRQPKSLTPTGNLYDEDLSAHTISVTDWFNEDAEAAAYRYYRMKVFYSNIVTSILVNGIGYRLGNPVPMQVFYVDQNVRYRFRVIHAGVSVCPIEMRIDGHRFNVIATDGVDIKAVLTDVLVLTNGERYDVVVDANKEIKRYSIQFIGREACNNIATEAILHYNGAPIRTVVPSPLDSPNATKLNCLNEEIGTPNCKDLITLETFKPIDPDFLGEPSFQYYIALDMINYARPVFRGVGDDVLFNAVLNNIIMINPTTPLYESTKNTSFCNRENNQTCKDPICECVHIIELPFKCVVEIIYVDIGTLDLVHPMHLHGYSFRVVAQGRIASNVTVEQVKELDRQGKIIRNFNNPPLKDTASVPDGGYLIIRFKTNNPGYWLMHCHVDFHTHEGMMMVFKTGEPKKTPKYFPRCGNYLKVNPLYIDMF